MDLDFLRAYLDDGTCYVRLDLINEAQITFEQVLSKIRTASEILDECKIVIRTPSNKPQSESEIERMMGGKAKLILDKKEINKPTFQVECKGIRFLVVLIYYLHSDKDRDRLLKEVFNIAYFCMLMYSTR